MQVRVVVLATVGLCAVPFAAHADNPALNRAMAVAQYCDAHNPDTVDFNACVVAYTPPEIECTRDGSKLRCIVHEQKCALMQGGPMVCHWDW